MMSLKPTLTAAAVAAALSGMALPSFAQEAVKTEQVKVTASRVEQELLDVPMSVSVITQKQIEQSGAKTVGDLLEDIPGVEIKNDGGQGIDRIKIRGEDAFRTLVMIDGQKVAEHKSMSGAPILIDPSMIERIEVIKGPASVLYGSDAIGGAVNIITKKGGNKPFQGEVSAGFDTSASGKNASASIYGGLNGWEYRLSAAVENYENLETPIGEVPNTNFQSRGASAYLAYNVTNDIKVGATVDYYDLEFMSGTQFGGYKDFYVDVPKWDRLKGAVFFEMKNISDYLTRVRFDAFHQQSNKDMTNHVVTDGTYEMESGMRVPAEVSMNSVADNKLKQTGISIQSDWQLGINYLIAGYEMSYDDLSASTDMSLSLGSSFFDQINPDLNPLGVTKTYNTWDGNQTQHSIYASMETPINDFTFSYGARYTWVSSESTNNGNGQVAGVMNPEIADQFEGPFKPLPEGFHDLVDDPTKLTQNEKRDSSDGRVVFNFGVMWHAAENLTLRGTWAQGYRFPILQELYVNSSMGGELTYANPNLKPETSDNFELGLRWNMGRFNLDTALFYSKADDYIDTLTIAEGVNQYDNISEATTFGWETTLSLRVLDSLEPYASFAFMRRKFEQNNISTFDSGTPEITARYGVRWNDTLYGLNVRADAYAVTRSESVQKNFAYDPSDPDSQKESFHLGGSTTLNLTAGISFGKNSAHSLDVGLYNITDKRYQTSDAIYEAGRYFTVKWNSKF